MSRCLNCLLVAILNWTVVNSKVDLDSPVRLAHCRATCLYKIQNTITSDKICVSSVNCTQCWETCELLQRDRSPCNQLHCGVGCQEACRFPLLSRTSAGLPQNEETLLLRDSCVSWPSIAAVYVVMGQRGGRPWGQLLQTLESSAPIPPDLDLESVRVLEVQWQGLTKVYSPPPESPIAQLEAVLRSLGLDDKIVANTETSETSLTQNVTSAVPLWNLRVESMTQNFPLMMTQICWLAREEATNFLTYLVTWQLGEGVLRGNLLTNSSCATLSLRPDTIYRVQVALLSPGSHEGESETLVVDTHFVHTESPSHVTTVHATLTQSPDPGTQFVVGVAAAVIVFLVVTLSLTWRWRHRLSLPHTKLTDEDLVTPNIYRVYPPTIRLVAEPADFRHIFSDTTSLLEG